MLFPAAQLPLFICPTVVTLHTLTLIHQQAAIKDSCSSDDEGISFSAPLTMVDKFCPATHMHTHTHLHTHTVIHPVISPGAVKGEAVKHTAAGYLLLLLTFIDMSTHISRALICQDTDAAHLSLACLMNMVNAYLQFVFLF